MKFENLINKVSYTKWENKTKFIPDRSIDLIITDPPFKFKDGNFIKGGGILRWREGFVNVINEYSGNFNPELMLNESRRLLKRFNGYFFTSRHLLKEYISFAEKHKYSWDIHIWSKRNHLPFKNGWLLPDCEFIVFMWQKGAVFNLDLAYHNYRKVHNDIIMNFIKRSEHPNEKPLSLIKKFLQLSSKPGDLVVDFFSGSGTVAIESRRMNRNFIAFERNRIWKADAFRHIRDWCIENTVPYFHKQHGGTKYINGLWGGNELDGMHWHQFPDLQHPAVLKHKLKV